jgi:mono/diheme cytochrome c family protein
MKVAMKSIMVAVAIVAVGLVSGCGGGGGGGVTAPSGAGASPSSAPSAGGASAGAVLYEANCADCHGALAVSSKTGVTLSRLQTAISKDTGGMGSLSALTAVELQAIVAELNPVTPPATPSTDGVLLYGINCATCHNALATSTKKGITLIRLQDAVAGDIGTMGSLSALTNAQLQAIVDALAVSAPPPATTDGVALYAANCSNASCHGALATSSKAGATATRIQTAINNNVSGMGSLSFLTPTQMSAIASALGTVTTPSTPPPSCGSCHAIPPAAGKHAKHTSRQIACATCHGTGYSPTTVNAATHNNGVKNLTTTIGWNAISRSCSNSCHGSRSW